MILQASRASLAAALLFLVVPSDDSPAVVAPPGVTSPEAQPPALLVSPRELSRELRDPSLVLLHVGPKEDYDAGHIEGARLVQMRDLAATQVEGGPVLELPDEAELRRRVEALGIGDRSRIVVIAGADWGSPATRILFTLQAAGLGANTRLLDGGSEGWKRARLPVTTEAPPPPKPGRLTLAADRSLVVDHTWMQSRIGAPGVRIIDARAPMFFEGAGMRDHAAGHIPGARNVPFNTVMDDSLQVLPLAKLRSMFAAAGVQPGDTVAAYCHIGQQATVVVLAARLLGIPVRLYDGSFTDWEARKLPVENATAPRGGSRPGR